MPFPSSVTFYYLEFPHLVPPHHPVGLSYPNPVRYPSLALFCLTWNPLANHPPQHTHTCVMIHVQERHLIVLLSQNEKELQTTNTNLILQSPHATGTGVVSHKIAKRLSFSSTYLRINCTVQR